MNEQLQIQKEQARLSIIGECYPDALTNSGDGDDIAQELIDVLEDLDIDLPDFDPEEWDDIPVLPGFDEDGDPILIYIDPDTGDIEIWELDIDPLDFQDILDDLDLTDICPDLDITGLDINGLDSIVTCDTDLILHVDNLPTALEIVTMPKKLRYIEGTRIDLSGMIVKAVKEDGSTWTSVKYPNGHIPLGEMIVFPTVAEYQAEKTLNGNVGANQAFAQETGYGYNRTYTKRNNNDPSFGAVFLRDNLCLDPILVSTTSAGAAYNWTSSGTPIRYNGATYYWSAYGGLFPASGGQIVWALAVLGGPMSAEDAALQILAMAGAHGSDEEGKEWITITWLRPGDSMPLSTSFEIEVLEKGHGGGR